MSLDKRPDSKGIRPLKPGRQDGVASGPREAGPKVGRPRIEDQDKTLAATKPWLALGMSRATWYNRQAEQRKAK